MNIRFDEKTDGELETTAQKLGVSKSALVRHITVTFLREVGETGSIPIDPNWSGMMGLADARSGWGERKLPEKKKEKVDYKSELKKKKS